MVCLFSIRNNFSFNIWFVAFLDLFELAQKLIDLYPEREISWYVLGCYYHLIEKVDLARRFLLKSTTLNCFFAPAWLLYGHSFSQESEHDQAISAFFKAAHFMPGCHLPLLYIGVEYILTDNCRLGEKFIMKALTIAPKDPLTLHELGIIAFNTNEYEVLAAFMPVIYCLFIFSRVIRAERHFKAALSILKYNQNPTALPNRYDTLLNNMGHVKRKINRPLEAIEFHKNALIMSPQSAPSYTAIGFIYCQLSKWKEAVDYLDMAYGLNKLQRNEDPHTKTLLENHALKNYQRNCRDSLGFELNQFDCSYTNAKRLSQPLQAINIRKIFSEPASSTELADSSPPSLSEPQYLDPPLKLSELTAKFNETLAHKNSLRFVAR